MSAAQRSLSLPHVERVSTSESATQTGAGMGAAQDRLCMLRSELRAGQSSRNQQVQVCGAAEQSKGRGRAASMAPWSAIECVASRPPAA